MCVCALTHALLLHTHTHTLDTKNSGQMVQHSTKQRLETTPQLLSKAVCYAVLYCAVLYCTVMGASGPSGQADKRLLRRPRLRRLASCVGTGRRGNSKACSGPGLSPPTTLVTHSGLPASQPAKGSPPANRSQQR